MTYAFANGNMSDTGVILIFSMAVIYVQAFVFVILFGKLMRKIFFGRLRAAEFEHLLERSWYAVTETCLAFTVFKYGIMGCLFVISGDT